MYDNLWLEIFSLVLVWLWCNCFSWYFSCLGFWALCICKSMSFIKFGEFGLLFLQIFLFCFILLLTLQLYMWQAFGFIQELHLRLCSWPSKLFSHSLSSYIGKFLVLLRYWLSCLLLVSVAVQSCICLWGHLPSIYYAMYGGNRIITSKFDPFFTNQPESIITPFSLHSVFFSRPLPCPAPVSSFPHPLKFRTSRHCHHY